MATLRDLKARIGSVGSSEKITGAMKMISSAKMHKAEAAIRRLLPFRTQLESIIGNLLSSDAEFTSPLTEMRPIQRISVVAIGSDEGLCGAYNANIFKYLLSHINTLRTDFPGVHISIIPVGAKMVKQAAKLTAPDITIITDATICSKSTGDDVKNFTRSLTNQFLSAETDRVDFVYMNFHSVSRQNLRADRILPVAPDTISDSPTAASRPYLFEPSAQEIFRTALPLMVLSSIQEIFCENRASEQAARVMAMQSANDNAKKLLDQLKLEYNKLRQQSITSELLDILGGQIR